MSKKIKIIFLFFILIISGYIVQKNIVKASSNLLTNGDFSVGDSTGWTIIDSGGSGAGFGGAYTTSYAWCSISQTVDLVAQGYTADQLDSAPSITFDVTTWQRFDHDGEYYLEYKLLTSDGSTVATSSLYGSVSSPIYLSADTAAFSTEYTFSNYGTGVRYAYIKIAGRDGSPDWGGQYGPYFDDASITISDTTNPSVSYFNPADNSSDISATATFEIAFDESVATSSGNIYLYKASDDSLVETIDVTGSKVTASSTNAFIIDPSTTLASETEYYFMIDITAIDDTSSNSYAGITASTTWSFTTADTDAPGVSSLSPVDDSSDIDIDANLVITFDEIVATSSGNIIIYKTSDDSTVETIDITSSAVTGNASTTLTINPSSDFSYETEYYVMIDSTAIDDASGNSYAGITASTTWSFTTKQTPTCPTIDNASTYNAYPTCGVATCNTGYSLSNGACVSDGGVSWVSILPSSVGSGSVDRIIDMYKQEEIGGLGDDGLNILLYIGSSASFEANSSKYQKVSKHNIGVLDLDMINKNIKITINHDNEILSLRVGDKKGIDLDQDGIDDIVLSYNNLNNNVIDLTISEFIQTVYQDSISEKYKEGELLKEKNKSAVYLIENNKKRAFFNEQAFLEKGFQWKDIIEVEEIDLLDGELIYARINIVIPEKDMITEDNKYYFSKDLKAGDRGEDVKELQKFLNNSGFILVESGFGSPGNETDFFGKLTWEALVKFQQSKNIDPVSGFFDSATRELVNK